MPKRRRVPPPARPAGAGLIALRTHDELATGRAAEYREATREFHPEHLEWNRSACTATVSQ